MKRIITWIVGLAVLLGLLAFWIATAPTSPVALIRVVDVGGKPVADAVIERQGLRTKPGPYQSGWYSWQPKINGVPNPPVTTDSDGFARLPYPKYVFERIETGTLCLAVEHPDFVPDRPERKVATALPAGAPFQARVTDLWNRILRKQLFARPEPVVLQKGAVLKVSALVDAATKKDWRLFVQVADLPARDTNVWTRPEPGVVVTRRLADGSHTLRVVGISDDHSVWFSDVVPIVATRGLTNEIVVDLKRGATVSGRLDDSVPRPVKNGRVVAHVWPKGIKPQNDPPQWHAWSAVSEDGSFSIPSMPEGDLEVVALCDGFVSTNGPGQSSMRYPQKHSLGTNDLQITVGTEPTARLEVLVVDEKDQPVKDLTVVTWPNVRYGEWAANILVSDCYNSAETLVMDMKEKLWQRPHVPDFQGISDSSGLAILPNLPATVTELAVDHPVFVLPAMGTAAAGKHRQATFTLVAGQTNRITVQVERREQSAITHY